MIERRRVMKKIAIITSGGANFYSIEMALERVGLNYELTHDADVMNSVDGVLLPGVGSASYAMEAFKRDGLIDAIRNYKKPLLGICLGMQLLFDYSEEGDVDCLGIIPGKITRFDDSKVIVPHMGWDSLSIEKDSPLLDGIDLSLEDLYFVHSFFAPLSDATIASCNYGIPFSAMVNKDNFYGMQFHPEKSSKTGEKLFANFAKML